MKIDAIAENSENLKEGLLVFPHWKGVKRFKSSFVTVQKELMARVLSRIEKRGFEGKLGEVLPIRFWEDDLMSSVMVGAGEKKTIDFDRIRQFGAHLVKIAEAEKETTIILPLEMFQETSFKLSGVAQALAEGMLLASYRFHVYHGVQTKKQTQASVVERVLFCVSRERDVKAVQEGVRIAEALSSAVHLSRDLVNTPATDMTPKHLAQVAQDLVDADRGITCKIISAKEMKRLGMGSALAVARGSEHEPVGIHLTYTPRVASKRSVAIVGKAVTFDSGGLSLKPAKSMETMKCDMAGSATVLGLFKALRDLQPEVTVHGIFLAVENMPGGSAFRPGDVVTAMDGTTIEVLNTDAEGRLTLADALVYATEQKPDLMIDLATLTGACIVALGDDITALLSNNERLAEKLSRASEETGEMIWELPLHAPYHAMMKSKLADLKNISSGHGAGTITAGLFLQPFVKNIPWAHLDIAGPSFTERPSRPDVSYGGTGFGVRLLANFLQKF